MLAMIYYGGLANLAGSVENSIIIIDKIKKVCYNRKIGHKIRYRRIDFTPCNRKNTQFSANFAKKVAKSFKKVLTFVIRCAILKKVKQVVENNLCIMIETCEVVYRSRRFIKT